MGIIRKNIFSYTILLKATSKNLKMLRFTVFTVLATVAMLTEAASGGGYYYKKAKKPAPAPAPATRTAGPGNLVEVAQKLSTNQPNNNLHITIFQPVSSLNVLKKFDNSYRTHYS